jgi:2-polyprenyl-6-methoxyphenol hydroxylase-like FAD-dependent oxidoreductase
LAEVDRAEDFYFDSISQIRTPSWARGRVALVGDAGYSPGPAVGGGTTLAVAASHVLAGELAAAGGDHVVGFRAYENEIRTAVDAFQAVGPTSMRRLVPRSRGQVWLTAQFARLLPAIPTRLLRRLSSGEGRFAGALSRISVKDYAARSAPREAAAE